MLLVPYLRLHEVVLPSVYCHGIHVSFGPALFFVVPHYFFSSRTIFYRCTLSFAPPIWRIVPKIYFLEQSFLNCYTMYYFKKLICLFHNLLPKGYMFPHIHFVCFCLPRLPKICSSTSMFSIPSLLLVCLEHFICLVLNVFSSVTNTGTSPAFVLFSVHGILNTLDVLLPEVLRCSAPRTFIVVLRPEFSALVREV